MCNGLINLTMRGLLATAELLYLYIFKCLLISFFPKNSIWCFEGVVNTVGDDGEVGINSEGVAD